MVVSRVAVHIASALLLTAAGIGQGGAQDASPSPAPAARPTTAPAPRACGAWIQSALAGPNRYAVVIDITHPLDEVDIRLDDRQGHWVFNATERTMLLLAPVRSDEVGLSVVAVRLTNGTKQTCIPNYSVPASGQRGAAIVAQVGNLTPLFPVASFVDAPATCAVPFANATTLEAAQPFMPPGNAYGRVLVKVSLGADSSIANASIYSSPSAMLNGSALQAVRASRFRTATFRCQGVAADYLFTVEYDRF